MTREQMEELAEIIFQKLVQKQAEFDKKFFEELKSTGRRFEIEYNTEYYPPKSHKEKLVAEYKRLSSLLSRYEEEEQYEKAAIIKNKLNKIEDKLKKL